MSIGNVTTNEGVEELRDILHNGLLKDVYNAECYNTVHKIISNHHKSINKSDKIKRDFFSIYSELAQNTAILSLSRIYDRPSKYKTRCVLYLLKRLSELANTLPKIEEPYQTISLLEQYCLPESCCVAVKDIDTSRFPLEFVRHYKSIYKDNKSLKDFRNKIIAHNEKHEEMMTFTWQMFDELINFAIQTIDVIGMAYFGTSFAIKRDAEYRALSVEVMLKELSL